MYARDLPGQFLTCTVGKAFDGFVAMHAAAVPVHYSTWLSRAACSSNVHSYRAVMMPFTSALATLLSTSQCVVPAERIPALSHPFEFHARLHGACQSDGPARSETTNSAPSRVLRQKVTERAAVIVRDGLELATARGRTDLSLPCTEAVEWISLPHLSAFGLLAGQPCA